MPAPRSDTNPRPKARHLRPWLLAGTSGLVIVVVGAGVLYNLRGAIGARLAVDYLARRGVPAEIVIDRIDLGGFVGHGRLGPAADPDLTVDRIEAEFEPIPVLRSGLAAPRLRSLRLIHPRLKASFDGKQLGFGTLQPAQTLRWVIPGTLCLALGCQMILTSFFLGVLRLDTRGEST